MNIWLKSLTSPNSPAAKVKEEPFDTLQSRYGEINTGRSLFNRDNKKLGKNRRRLSSHMGKPTLNMKEYKLALLEKSNVVDEETANSVLR